MNLLTNYTAMVSRAPAACIIMVSGQEVQEYYPLIQSVEVSQPLQGTASARLSFSISRDAKGDWDILNDQRIKPWVKIEIQVSFDNETETLFNGYVRQVNSDIPQQGNPGVFNLECEDLLAHLDRTTRHKTWPEQMTDKAILTEILAKPYGLTLSKSSAEGQKPGCHQEATDYRFINRRAWANRYQFYLRGKEIYFGPGHIFGAPQGTLKVRAGCDSNCTSINIEHDGYRPDKIGSQIASRKTAETESSKETSRLSLYGSKTTDSTQSGLSDFIWFASSHDARNTTQANAYAQGAAKQNSFKLKATGQLDGTKYGGLLISGTSVEVDGIGIYNGKWYVDTTTHKFDQNGYFVDFTLISNATEGTVSEKNDKLSKVR